ncbi:hypothetical protein F7725_022496 [Dissostichus mawsoni]|uniref:Uncharacterized protein n=1 Tax=Dissostichus mawsoni TaxID=36200 RepID=A0A7J5Z048_DISMA|nr:hypothetical protein F7725_022496 [Dissostichus mawsoni]
MGRALRMENMRSTMTAITTMTSMTRTSSPVTTVSMTLTVLLSSLNTEPTTAQPRGGRLPGSPGLLGGRGKNEGGKWDWKKSN